MLAKNYFLYNVFSFARAIALSEDHPLLNEMPLRTKNLQNNFKITLRSLR
ncbi:hypothetical protein J3D55_000105 [Chryseobacterium ginsenosidimutans]|nr:hypothetical protein [Chryseobacterium ginsenosidimutans]